MNAIFEDRISKNVNKYVATCICGRVNEFTSKSSAVRMLRNEVCKSCMLSIKNKNNLKLHVYRNADDKWCSMCTSCGCEQVYSRRQHAIRSSRFDIKCNRCAIKTVKFSRSNTVSPQQRMYNKAKLYADMRDIPWHLTVEDMFSNFKPVCALSGMPISIDYDNTTASLDRIDSTLAYTVDNIQWLHKDINMLKNKYSQHKFIEMCIMIADNIRSKL